MHLILIVEYGIQSHFTSKLNHREKFMKTKIIKLSHLLTVALVFFCISCPTETKQPTKGDDPVVQLPEIKVIEWKPTEDGYIQFCTNDKKLRTSTGATYWYPLSFKNNPGNELIVSLNKISGRSSYGFGIIFCIQDEPAADEFIAKNFYTILINTEGLYQIIKIVNRVPYTLTIPGADDNGWVKAINADGDSYLQLGKNVVNNIRIITKDDNSNDIPEFEIYMNNNLVYHFEDNFTESNDHKSTFDLYKYSLGKDKYGYIVTLSPVEDFPYVPIDVRFKMTVPLVPDKLYSNITINKNNIKKSLME
jgi:hypothetical protein